MLLHMSHRNISNLFN